ncbi:Imm50 family immunity protein [Streptomyces sp. NPDC051636]|uniref:Imm50 family immunity protein n=1 Tax=Streptomyces sp. NPDC051636 TaxID=3365663 RepID=UPI0037BDE787
MIADGLLVNPQILHSLYSDDLPELKGVHVRSVNLSPRGPTVTLRMDLPTFPGVPPQEWRDEGMDTVQCQLQFVALDNLSLTLWDPPAVADIEAVSLGSDRRMRVTASGSGLALRFDCADSVRVGHVSAFRKGANGSDSGRHLFLSKVDARRHTVLPGAEEKTFYER